MNMIDIIAVKKNYGRTPAVRGVDIAIGAGEFVVILGPSGCGKSTLLRMIAGLEDITEGTVAIEGRVVNHVEPGQRGCAMVFQNYALYPHMTVAENIGYALKVAGVAKAQRRERVEAVARMLELDRLLERKPAQLSGGQRQRVAMGRAMIRSPKVFLFDEPLSNLDARLRLQMRLEIKRLHRELQATSLFVTHDQVEAMTLADRLVVMSDGRVEQIGTPREVYQRPATRFVAEFLGAPPINMFSAVIDANGRPVIGEGLLLCGETRFALAAGTPVSVGVRPNAFTLQRRGAPGSMPFAIEMQEDLGSEIHVHGEAAGHAVTVARPAGALIPAHDLAISAAPAALHVFAADGTRVEPAARPQIEITEGDPRWTAKQALSI